MHARRHLTIVVALVLLTAPIPAKDGEENDRIWSDFSAWFVAAPENASLLDYAAELKESGLSAEEVQRRISIIGALLSEDAERGIELTYDRIFSRPLSGDPETDGFTSTPSVFMVESVAGLEPGTALDVGSGQGRNAVWLALHGWDVTALDLSGTGLAVARENAEKAGTRLTTVKMAYADFDFGADRWDLILMILSWAPVSDPAFVARLHAALRPGGVLVFEHVIDKPDEPFPPYVHPLQPGALREYFDDFRIEHYDESERLGDWGGPPTPIVRMVARKK